MGKTSISIFTTKWGHGSIGTAVYQSLKKDRSVDIHLNDIEIDRFSELAYMPIYKLFPAFFKFHFRTAENENVAKVITSYLDKRYSSQITRLIEKQRPKTVINTYFGFNQTLEKISKKYKFTYINVVADPLSIHKLAVSQNGYNFVFDDKAKRLCHMHGIPNNQIISSGWFVRDEYNTNYDLGKVRTKLGLSSNCFTLTIVGGSAGNYSVLKALPGIIKPNTKIQVIFVSGKSKYLLKSARLFSEMFSSETLNFVPIGYKKNLHEYLQASDLVIGKAGPNLLFESIAVKKPFLAVSHISGQEDGNLDIMRKNKLGFVEENPIKVIKLLRSIIDNPSKLIRFVKPINKMAGYNSKAGKILRNFINSKTQGF